MPGTAAEQAFDLCDYQGNDEISNQKRNRTALLTGNGFFESSKKSEQNKNWADKQDLPLEVITIGLLSAHAREH
jgi:hypothetical protein